MIKHYSSITRFLVAGLFMLPLLLTAQTEPNDFCADAIPLACNTTVSGSTVFATLDTEVNGTSCGTSINAPGVWYTVEGTGFTLVASTCNAASYDTKISVFTGSCGALVCEGGIDDSPGCAGFTTEFSWESIAGTTYYVFIHGFGGASGTFDLTMTCLIPPEISVSPDEFTFLVPLEDSDSDIMTITNSGAAGALNLDWTIGKFEPVPSALGAGSSSQYEQTQQFVINDQTLSEISSGNISREVLTELQQLIDRPMSDKDYFAEMLQRTIGEDDYAKYGMSITEHASMWKSSEPESASEILAAKYALVEEDKQRAEIILPMAAGGSDLFGYQYIDSDEAGGPVFSWTDITSTGTEIISNGDYDGTINSADDAYKIVSLPFTFNFYGVAHTEVKVSSNGYLTFGPDGTDFSNDPIPLPNDPNDHISPFWDDLDPNVGGTIHYESGVDQFIVQYTGLPRFVDEGTSVTFQVILNVDGSILYQYLNMSGTLNSSTIGIENADASSGLQVAFNSVYVHNNLAVLIAESCQWLTSSSASGSTAEGITDDVTVNADAAGLDIDTYYCNLVINSNAINENPVVVPVTMIVGTPLERIDELIAKVEALEDAGVLNQGQANALIAKLNAAKMSIEKGNNNTAINQLNAFKNQVNAFMNAGILTSEQGGELIDCANEIIDLLTNYPDFKSGEVSGAELESMSFEGYSLEQNYPNPFDGNTTISFSLSESNPTTLRVYNSIGQEVATLFEEVTQPDKQYTVSFDGSNHPKGVYFYHLKSGEQVDTVKKMILIK